MDFLNRDAQEKRAAEYKETLKDLGKAVGKAEKEVSADQEWIRKAQAEIAQRQKNIENNQQTIWTTKGEMKIIEKWLAK